MTIRIYGEILNTWTTTDENGKSWPTQHEWSYKDYDSETGEVVGCGTEDIQCRLTHLGITSNWMGRMDSRTVYVWTGKLYPSGNKVFHEAKTISFRPGDRATVVALGKLARRWYEGQEIQIRQY